MPKQKDFTYEFSASETVHYDIKIEATSEFEALNKLYAMQTEDFNRCVSDTSNFESELIHTNEPNKED